MTRKAMPPKREPQSCRLTAGTIEILIFLRTSISVLISSAAIMLVLRLRSLSSEVGEVVAFCVIFSCV